MPARPSADRHEGEPQRRGNRGCARSGRLVNRPGGLRRRGCIFRRYRAGDSVGGTSPAHWHTWRCGNTFTAVAHISALVGVPLGGRRHPHHRRCCSSPPPGLLVRAALTCADVELAAEALVRCRVETGRSLAAPSDDRQFTHASHCGPCRSPTADLFGSQNQTLEFSHRLDPKPSCRTAKSRRST